MSEIEWDISLDKMAKHAFESLCIIRTSSHLHFDNVEDVRAWIESLIASCPTDDNNCFVSSGGITVRRDVFDDGAGGELIEWNVFVEIATGEEI
jgi:hypothetical protein